MLQPDFMHFPITNATSENALKLHQSLSSNEISLKPTILNGHIGATSLTMLGLSTLSPHTRKSDFATTQILEQLPIGVIVLKQDGTIELVNPKCERLVGQSQSRLLGISIAHLFKEGRNKPLAMFLKEVKERSLGEITELTLMREDGSELAVEFSLVPFETNTTERKSLGVIIDVNARLEVLRLRKAFATTVGHELRTPLTSVGGYLDLIMDGVFGQISPRGKECADHAKKCVIRLITLINELLDAEKVESGMLGLNRAPCFVSNIIDEAVNSVWNLAKSRNISFAVSHEPIEFVADNERIIQALINLLANAIKYSPDYGLIQVDVTRGDSFVEIGVVDNGPGIPQALHGVIFERFQQVLPADGKKRSGTGLGLSITRTIIEQHGGTIGVESTLDVGSRFWFRLPCDN